MSRILKYKAIIKSYLEKHVFDDDLMNWIEAQPVLDQPDILRALNAVLLEKHDTKSGLDKEEVCKIFEDKIHGFEESILDQKLQESLIKLEIENSITDVETFEYYLDYMRQEIITRIVSNPENQENWDFVHKIIQIEKKSGFYNPVNWKSII